ncbi:MAG: hypothetical protein ACJ8J0_00095 [Longimicrobiaceae bacterium]
MANLRNFMWSGSRDGMPLDIYLNRTPQIGNGELQVAQPLRVVLKGEATVFGKPVAGTVEIRMPDESPGGTCTVILNGVTHADCPYRTDGSYLKIQVADRELSLSGNDKQWTWLGVSGVPAWIGFWPASAAMPEDEAERELEAVPA